MLRASSRGSALAYLGSWSAFGRQLVSFASAVDSDR
jgi:hypothetical protein